MRSSLFLFAYALCVLFDLVEEYGAVSCHVFFGLGEEYGAVSLGKLHLPFAVGTRHLYDGYATHAGERQRGDVKHRLG